MKKVGIIVLIVLLIDQISKFYIKTNFHLNEGIYVFGWEWFQLKFVENPGMAYGAEFGGLTGKMLLSVLRIFLIAGIGWYIWKNIKIHNNNYFKVGMAFVFAGAIGNLVDSLFYGMIFDTGLTWNSERGGWDGYSGISEANFQGYSGFLKGCVVDMFYFPLFEFTWPDWIPGIGGKHFEFFSYIFNVADSAITVGGAIILIFRNKVFR
ncbi:MAG: lipoprotein signal peptidase [Flavobacteriaceae bacterium]|nr:lipoprotein signal peptidase [Flavobacteriaceae bacterium]